MKNDLSYKKFFTEAWLRFALQIITMVVMATLAFADIKNSIISVAKRVDAVEGELGDRAPLVERFLQLEERDKTVIEDIKELKGDMKTLMKAHGVQSSVK